jgi:hypothetical protein
MSTTSHRRSLSRSPISAPSPTSSDRQQLSQKVQQQRTYRRPFSESLNHPDDGDDDNPGNDHHEERDDANVAVGELVRGGADIDDADDSDDNIAAFDPWGQFYDNHCTYLPAVRVGPFVRVGRIRPRHANHAQVFQALRSSVAFKASLSHTMS